jgi:hypothetical protein
MKMNLNRSTRLLFFLAAFGGGFIYLLRREITKPQLAALAAYLVLVFLLRGQKTLVDLFHASLMGGLLVFCWLKDQSGGLFPTLFTIIFVINVYDAAISWRRRIAATRGNLKAG